MSSILKEKKISLDLESNFSISKFVDTVSIKRKIEQEDSLILNNTRIIKQDGLYYVKSFKNLDKLLNEFLSLKLEVISIVNFIEHLMLDKEIIVRKSSDVLLFSYIELLFIYYILQSKYKNAHKTDLYLYLKRITDIVGKQVLIKVSKDKSSGLRWTRSTLLETAMGSIEWVRDKYHPYISDKANLHLNKINARLVEIPKDYDLNKLEYTLKEMSSILDDFKIEKRDFIIRFRKIKKLKKTGLFIVAANTIILDPRESSSFKHELGHYVFENKISINVSGKSLYPKDFSKIVDKNKAQYAGLLEQHRIEDYKEDSEVFAYSFEQM